MSRDLKEGQLEESADSFFQTQIKSDRLHWPVVGPDGEMPSVQFVPKGDAQKVVLLIYTFCRVG